MLSVRCSAASAPPATISITSHHPPASSPSMLDVRCSAAEFAQATISKTAGHSSRLLPPACSRHRILLCLGLYPPEPSAGRESPHQEDDAKRESQGAADHVGGEEFVTEYADEDAGDQAHGGDRDFAHGGDHALPERTAIDIAACRANGQFSHRQQIGSQFLDALARLGQNSGAEPPRVVLGMLAAWVARV